MQRCRARGTNRPPGIRAQETHTPLPPPPGVQKPETVSTGLPHSLWTFPMHDFPCAPSGPCRRTRAPHPHLPAGAEATLNAD